MLKPIGSLHNVPLPSAAVLGESLKLLATFGDKKSISPLLEEMREVQANNERVFREAQEAIGELTVKRKELDESYISFATKKLREEGEINHRMEACSQAEARLSGKASDFDHEQDLAISELEGKQGELSDRERAILVRESKCEDRERDLDSRLAMVTGKEAVLINRERELQSRENKLRAVLDGG